MLVKEAERIIYALSEPSKMPGYAYSLPTSHCITGSKLREMANSVCSKCYACKGRSTIPKAVKAQIKRLQAIDHPQWVKAMITVLKNKKVRYFRWHDSGDLQSVEHLKKIMRVCDGVPDMMFWLPTKERTILNQYFTKYTYVPENLCIRLSATLIDSEPADVDYNGQVQTCTVHWKKDPYGKECKSYENEGKCGDCRACWDKDVLNVSYKKH